MTQLCQFSIKKMPIPSVQPLNGQNPDEIWESSFVMHIAADLTSCLAKLHDMGLCHRYVVLNLFTCVDVRSLFKLVGSGECFTRSRCVLWLSFTRDIKPSNCLLTYQGQFVIGDFGMSCFLGDNDVCTSQVGSMVYCSVRHPCFLEAHTSFVSLDA